MKTFILLAGVIGTMVWSSSAMAAQLQPASDPSFCVTVQSELPLTKPVKRTSKLVLEKCQSGAPTQIWKNDRSEGAFVLRANVEDEGRGLCIGVPGPVAQNSMVLEVQGCSQTQQQLWTTEIDFEKSLVRFISSLGDGTKYCLDVRGGMMKAGNWIQLYQCNGTKAQDFLLR